MVRISPMAVYKALSEETRFNIILLLVSEGSVCVCEFESALKVEQPKISRHLALLRKEEILITERRGKWVYYQVNPDLPDWVNDIFAITQENEPKVQNDLLHNLKGMADRPSCCA